ncbi:hypothetical protein TIFTF001_006052 [Ficus carica]|uniref:F-box associated beta-propeller type 1 domain-containing protein n=1 Tax=Ficus carica TaxID=3494 RepID=A0AA88A3B6_FICCA|nr:hypothetical protein TIFTF001_006052 [Ficus carica]
MEKAEKEDVLVCRFDGDSAKEMLSQLGAEDLMRHRSLSSFFRDLIDDAHFIETHLQNSIAKTSNCGVLLWNKAYYWLDLQELEKKGVANATQLQQPLKEFGDSSVFGSCRGLVSIIDDQGYLAIWNPTTRYYRKLPSPPVVFASWVKKKNQFQNQASPTSRSVLGFGSAEEEDKKDLKVVRITQFLRGNTTFESHVRVYSSNRSSWGRVDPCPYVLLSDDFGILVQENLLWIMAKDRSPNAEMVITAFNLQKKEFTQVAWPQIEDFGADHVSKTVLGVLGGKLCLTRHLPIKIEIWVMDEYANVDSWSMKFRILGPIPDLLPIHLLGNGKLLLYERDSSLHLYDLENQDFDVSVRAGLKCVTRALICYKSLVRLDTNWKEVPQTWQMIKTNKRRTRGLRKH